MTAEGQNYGFLGAVGESDEVLDRCRATALPALVEALTGASPPAEIKAQMAWRFPTARREGREPCLREAMTDPFREWPAVRQFIGGD